MHRMRDELASQSANWEDRILQASKACEAWRSEADESNRKVSVVASPPTIDDCWRPINDDVGYNNSAVCRLPSSHTHITQAVIAEQQRDNALSHVQLVTEKLDQVNSGGGGGGGGGAGASMPRDLRSLSIQNLKGLQVRVTRTAPTHKHT